MVNHLCADRPCAFNMPLPPPCRLCSAELVTGVGAIAIENFSVIFFLLLTVQSLKEEAM